MYHPMQPLVWEDGVIRFNKNAIVRYLLDSGVITMNKLALLPFSDEDRSQFAQLIGYSVSSYGELSYALNVDETDALADLMRKQGNQNK